MNEEFRNRSYYFPARRLVAAASVVLVLWLAGGCGVKSDGFNQVVGKVTADGQPILKGSVSFRPDAEKGNSTQHHPTGDIDANGNYELYTVGKKGAPPGWYKVLVFADGNPEPAPGIPPKWLHDVKYTNEKTTDLWIEVVDKAPPGHYDLKLNR